MLGALDSQSLGPGSMLGTEVCLSILPSPPELSEIFKYPSAGAEVLILPSRQGKVSHCMCTYVHRLKLKDSPTHVSRAPSVESPLLYSHEEGTTTQHLGRGEEGGREGEKGKEKRERGEGEANRGGRREEGGGIERGWVRGKG